MITLIKKWVIKALNRTADWLADAAYKPDRPHLNEDANVAAVMGFLLFVIVALIGVVILSNVNKVVEPMVNDTTRAGGSLYDMTGYGYNHTFLNLVNTATGGANLLFVAIIIIAAAIIIGILLSSFMRGRE